ncbi:MAG: HNH endonuclease [Chromatiaceae bacterium]|nr:HNH endonuclease [Chromatiaceae bacterium]
MKPSKHLGSEYLKECLVYCPGAGILRWRERPSHHFKNLRTERSTNSRQAGIEAGYPHKQVQNTYLKIKIEGITYRAHRLAWLLYYGEWPCGEIDHINGDGLDNRIKNLRDVTVSVNLRNARMFSSNTSGVNGVTWDNAREKWIAQIKINGNRRFLGRFGTKEEAAAARMEANKKHGYTERHGKPASLTLND